MSDSDSEPQDGESQPWITIQKDTFTNWVNDKLTEEEVTIKDIRLDFRDGVNLCKLMRVLSGGPIGKIIQKDRPLNKYEARGNLALALQAMEKDKVTLVNIGERSLLYTSRKSYAKLPREKAIFQYTKLSLNSTEPNELY